MLTRENDTSEYGRFYDGIQGFSFEWGYEYRMKVETTPVPDPPADGSSVDYRLVELSSKTPVVAGTEFEVELAPLVRTSEDLDSVFSGDCVTGYTLFGKPLKFDAGMSCESFRAITSATIPNAVRFRFSTPEAPLSVVGMTPTLQHLEFRPYLQACRGWPGAVPCKWARTNGQGEFQGLSEAISGFTFEWGYEYGLVVDLRILANPPQDGSSREYTLVQLAQKAPVDPGTEFDLALSGYTQDDLPTIVRGNCALGYKLLAADGPDLSFDAGVSCEVFASALSTTVPNAIRFRFSSPGGSLSVVSLL